MSEEEVEYTKAVYSARIRYWDEEFKVFYDLLEKKGWLDNTLIVLVADHGDEHYDHKGFGHGYTCYDETIHVPLIMYWPGQIPEG